VFPTASRTDSTRSWANQPSTPECDRPVLNVHVEGTELHFCAERASARWQHAATGNLARADLGRSRVGSVGGTRLSRSSVMIVRGHSCRLAHPSATLSPPPHPPHPVGTSPRGGEGIEAMGARQALDIMEFAVDQAAIVPQGGPTSFSADSSSWRFPERRHHSAYGPNRSGAPCQNTRVSEQREKIRAFFICRQHKTFRNKKRASCRLCMHDF